MSLTVSGHHIDVTQALHNYVQQKLQRVLRHFDQVMDMRVLLSVDKTTEKQKSQKAECTIHIKGQDLFAESTDADLYTAIDTLSDKLDRQVIRHKDRIKKGHHHTSVKRLDA